MLIVSIIIFVVSLFVLVKGADIFLGSAEKIGLAAGLSPFVVGVVIVGAGTSFPELISSLVAVFKGVPEIVVANAVGSNIANILLIIGATSIFARSIKSKTNLTNLELPIMAITSVIFLALAWDGSIQRIESIILLATFGFFVAYSVLNKPKDSFTKPEGAKKPKISAKDTGLLLLGLGGLVFGSKYLIDSVVDISTIFNIAPGAVSVVAVAFGTSLPELLVSIKAAIKGNTEVALGNVFGSNAFNILMVVGIPGLFSTLPIDAATMVIAVPAFVVVTLIFIISCLSNAIHKWEGFMYVILYLIFIGKVFSIF